MSALSCLVNGAKVRLTLLVSRLYAHDCFFLLMVQRARFTCLRCNHTFKTRPGLTVHISKIHQNPKPHPPQSTFQYHPHLTTQPCDDDGNFLAPQIPPPDEDKLSWAPFHDHPSFEFAELTYKKMQTSAGDLNNLLQLWAAHNVNNGGGDPIFSSTEEMHEAIDGITHGDAPWESFSVQYPGPTTASSPSWQRNKSVITVSPKLVG
jgi:Plavaka transposase